MSSVSSMEPDGITRAWPMVPLISKKTSATQNHAMTSRCTRWPIGTLGCASLPRLASAFMFHRHGMLAILIFTGVAAHCFPYFATRMIFAHLQLHQVRWVHAGVARRAIVALCVADRLLHAGQRNVTQRIRANEFANLLWRAGGGDEFLTRRSVDAVVARRNRWRATDAHVHFARTGFAHHAHDFAAGGAAHDGVIDENHALALNQAAYGVKFQLHAKIANR